SPPALRANPDDTRGKSTSPAILPCDPSTPIHNSASSDDRSTRDGNRYTSSPSPNAHPHRAATAAARQNQPPATYDSNSTDYSAPSAPPETRLCPQYQTWSCHKSSS